MSRIAIEFKDLKEGQVFNFNQDADPGYDRVIKGDKVCFADGFFMTNQEYVRNKAPEGTVWIEPVATPDVSKAQD